MTGKVHQLKVETVLAVDYNAIGVTLKKSGILRRNVGGGVFVA